ncbi:MAG: endonuclease III [Deltaproteobacteria bacterium]|nr:endonuclease III [Deltaproteobacteria bacterium]MBW2070522.1 endonuclease III [Deltaproteobacteria bacterium]
MRRRQTEKILQLLLETYGSKPWNWHTRQTPFQVLIGTVLSQRTRDEKTDEAARALFGRYPSAETLAGAPLAEVARLIRPVNYYRTKAERIRLISRIIVEEHGGRTPTTFAELTALPGVGRKTAGCVMVYGFRKPALPVDTHVHRIANRIGLIDTDTAEQSEQELWKIVPPRYIMIYNELMVKHGQNICRPISPQCRRCPIKGLCVYGRQNKGEK